MKSILDIFEHTEEKYSEKTAFVDEKKSCTFGELKVAAEAIGSCIGKEGGFFRKPVVICLPRSVESIMALLGVVYSGNFYVMMDIEMPWERKRLICQNLSPKAVLTDREHVEEWKESGIKAILLEEVLETAPDRGILKEIRKRTVETDLLYVLYTSGSTGVPKGVAVTHRNVMAYIEWLIQTFAITDETIFGNQTPFYFSMSVSDVYSTLFTGATLHILPKKLFSFPLRLMEYIKKEKINTIYWVPSALCIVANTKTLDYIELPDLKKVLFAGEVMPVKQLNMWMSHMPDILYANLYGPTETTDICAYYIVDRQFADDASLPIGYPCENCDLMVLNEKGETVKEGQEGELFVRGPFVAAGYYNNPERTAQAFVRNPKNPYYPEFTYKTGDLVRYGEDGVLLYNGRKDFQVKHMGYRIELGEIEAAASALDKMESCVCIYDEKEDKIILIYQAKLEPDVIRGALEKRVPRYMWPAKYLKLKRMPMNANGKTDRAWLKNNYKTL